ncbi:MAG: D-(-)-3-hydroxybutyrate oligomer hydrolase [Wenzhouxiangellaceae bacterium]
MRSLCGLILLSLLLGCQTASDDPVPQAQDQHADAGLATADADPNRVERQLADLASSGLGIAGITGPAPEFADPQAPTADELRQLAIHNNYHSLLDIRETSGFGTEFGPRQQVPGTEVLVWRGLPGMVHPHAVALELPAGFNTESPCLVAAATSGSRGVYGAVGIVGDWALQRGCAVVYTDKGAGTGFYDLDSGQGVGLTGQLTDQPAGFDPKLTADQTPAPHAVAVKHAHSGDNPEARCGEFVLDAVRFALDEIKRAHPDISNIRVIASGISNGGSAVLRAAEVDSDGLLDAVIVGEPNIYPPDSDHHVVSGDLNYRVAEALPLYVYATWMGLYQRCAALKDVTADAIFGNYMALYQQQLQAHCQALGDAGLLDSDYAPAQAAERLDSLNLTAGARRLGLFNITLNLWPAINATYAQAYQRQPVSEPVCDTAFASVDGQGQARATTLEERAAWFAVSSGVVPTAELVLVDTSGQAIISPRQLVEKGQCWRKLWDDQKQPLHQSIQATRASGNPADIPILIVHGRDDSLIPVNHSSRPYVAALGDRSVLRYYEVENAQHFDALLDAPGANQHVVALHPYLLMALEHSWDYLDNKTPPPPSQVVRTQPGEAYRPAALRTDAGEDAIVFADGVLRVPE